MYVFGRYLHLIAVAFRASLGGKSSSKTVSSWSQNGGLKKPPNLASKRAASGVPSGRSWPAPSDGRADWLVASPPGAWMSEAYKGAAVPACSRLEAPDSRRQPVRARAV